MHILFINRGDIILYQFGRFLLDLLGRTVGVKVFILIIFISVLLSSLAITTTNVQAGVFAHPDHMPLRSPDVGMLKNSAVQVLPPDGATPTPTPLSTLQPSTTATSATAMTAQPASTETDTSSTIVISVLDPDGNGKPDQAVYVFIGIAYTGKHGITNAGGQVSITLPSGSYHFRSDFNNTQFWSSASNACDTSNGCNSATITIPRPVTITVKNTDGITLAGLPVYAFDGNTFKGFSGNTDANGQASLSLPQGNYRFRADLNSTQFWSGTADTCAIPQVGIGSVPGCTTDSVIVTSPVTVTVKDTSGAANTGLDVFVFTGTTYTNYSGKTDANGQMSLTLPQGNYHFRADLNGTQFWSSSDNTCTIPHCSNVDITVTQPVSVKVEGVDHSAFENIKVYAFDGTTYKGYSGTTGKDGRVSFTLPVGNYRFRGDLGGTQFWSSTDNACTLPGCSTTTITLPGGSSNENKVTINYSYDALNRLKAADYSDATFYHYTFDAVGNRLSQTTKDGTVNLQYDPANRLASVGGVAYQWDANGNLLNDGTTTYSFNAANQLIGLTAPAGTSGSARNIIYKYTGLGDRLQQISNGTTTNYTLDINSGLTQVLQESAPQGDGTNTYLYGNGRISQVAATQTGYFLPDALGSVRQMVDQSGALSLAKSYDPYGNVLTSSGTVTSMYGFDGESQDNYITDGFACQGGNCNNGLIYLRARYYSPYLNQFIQPDTYVPDPQSPQDWNRYTYTRNNPINRTDPSGLCSGNKDDINNPDIECWKQLDLIESSYSNIDVNPDNWATNELKSVKKAIDGMAFTFGGRDNFITAYDKNDKNITLYRANWFFSWFTGDKEAETAVGPRTITVYDKAYKTSYDIGSATVIHEFGHLLDAKYGNLSMGDFKNKFWNDCKPQNFFDSCTPLCKGVPASSYGENSPREDFSDLFAWYVWENNKWDVSVLFSEFMPPDQDRSEYMKNLISKIKDNE